MLASEIINQLEDAKRKIMVKAVREVNEQLAEVHHQVNVINEESFIVCVEFKRAQQAIEQAREYIKMVTL